MPRAATPPPDETDPRIGQIVAGRYRIEERLGRGGMGAVYRAVEIARGTEIALKVLLPELRAPATSRRFEREAKAARLLHHPHIVAVTDSGGLEDGGLFFAMELCRGASVAELVESGRVAPRRALVIARQVLDGLGYAHARGFVHRDLKPDNIMLVRAGRRGEEYERVKLIDFGLVKLLGDAAIEVGGGTLTETGMLFGTPAYMSPEHALGRSIDGRADLYALGVILFEMITGQRPFDAPDPLALLRLQVAKAPPTLATAAPGPWCTSEIEALLAGALRKKPEERFPDAEAMIAALERAFLSLDHLP